jgi:hypothetical protein
MASPPAKTACTGLLAFLPAALTVLVNGHITGKELTVSAEMTFQPQYPDFVFYEGEFDPSACPSTRGGHETQHTCAPMHRDACRAPARWEDHCHVYEWFVEYAAGDASRIEGLLRYYRRRVDEMLHRKFSYLDAEQGHAIGMEALMNVLSEYDVAHGVPAQAYIRTQLPRRITDRLRDEGDFSRAATDFDKRLQEVLEARPELDASRAAQLVVGMPDRHSTFTEARVADLMRQRSMRSALHWEYVSEDGGSEDWSSRTMVSAADTLDEVIFRETGRNAAKVVSELTAGMPGSDVELVLAYSAGGAAVTAWSEANGCSRADAAARAQALLSRLQGRAAELLNVSKATLAARTFERNEEKFLEALNTGRITPVGDALLPAPAPSWDVPSRGDARADSYADDDAVLFT